MRAPGEETETDRPGHIIFDGDRITMRHSPLPDDVVETLKLAVKLFAHTVRVGTQPAKCTFGELASAARKVYSENGDPRAAECLKALDLAHQASNGRSEPSAVHQKTGYVLTHPQNGIYLGSFLGLGFWSALDSGGQDAAVVFESPEAAMAFASTWGMEGMDPTERAQCLGALRCVEVVIDSPQGSDNYASMESCQAAGLDPWYNLDSMDSPSASVH